MSLLAHSCQVDLRMYRVAEILLVQILLRIKFSKLHAATTRMLACVQHSIHTATPTSLFCLFTRDESLGGVVDVVCYRDYTREGRRVNTHSLIIKDIKLPEKSDSEGKKVY